MNGRDRIWRSEAVSKQYLDGVRGAIPFAREQIEIMLQITRKAQPNVRRFLDLGCGDGILAQAFLGQFPQASAVLLDFSETMIAAARVKLAAAVREPVFLVVDYGQPAWVDSVRGHAPLDLIISGFSIHHQPDARKRGIYGEIFSLLAPGGLFLNLEHVASATPWVESLFDEHFVEALWRYHQQLGTGKTPEQIAEQYAHRPDQEANILAPVWEQCRWLAGIGFENVDCYFKAFELALFGGTKPTCGAD